MDGRAPTSGCGRNSSMGSSSLAAVDQKDTVVNRAQRMSSCDANLAFTKNAQSLNRLVLLYGLSGFVCVLGFQHVVSQVSHPQECEKH